MLKRLIALGLALCAAAAMAAIDANKASHEELLQIKGIGPATATRIIDTRQQAPFKSWDDLMTRVKGIAANTAGKLSQEGLTVNGQTFNPAATTASPMSTSSEKSVKPAQASSKKPEKS